MRRSRILAVALFLMGAVAVIEAQQRQPGGGGRGGFRLEVISLVATNADLQTELKVTDDQKDKLKAASDKANEARGKLFEGFKGGKGGFDKDRFAEIQKELEKASAESRKSIEAILTAEQKKRVGEIQLQADGIRAFSQDEVAAQLNLNDSQKGKIKGISEDYAKDSQELFGFGGGKGGGKGGFGKGGFDKEKAAENVKKREKLTKAAMADIEDVLTDAQRSKWKEMVGAPFDVSTLRTRGFGPGGPGGPGGGNKGKGRPKD